MARSKYSKEEKLAILTLYHDVQYSMYELASMFQIHHETMKGWKYKYEADGEAGLEEAASWKPYSKELKLAAVQDYLSGQYSL